MNIDILKSFFEAYSEASTSTDPTVLASHYADAFIASGPTGSAAFKNDEHFLAWLGQVYDFNRHVGMRSLEVVSIHETPISDHHAFATVQWGARFEKTGDERICFEISYLLRLSEGKPLIIAYISHEDQEDVMKARGVI
ncbi:MAG: hypothetical protein PVH95_07765 [Anaerolineae bacterium]